MNEKNLDRRKIARTLSVAFREGYSESAEEVLNEIEDIGNDRYESGFNEINFTLGVANCILITFVFAKYPEHFWLLYLIQSCLFLPKKVSDSSRTKPLNESLYLLDFCWMMNFLAVFVIVFFGIQAEYLEIISIIIPELRRSIFLASFGVACGPLLMATAVLPFVAMVFHDIVSMIGLFIHLLPPLVMYTIRWHGDEIKNAWSGVFQLDYLDNIQFFPNEGLSWNMYSYLGTVSGCTVFMYFLWFVPFSIWMILIGLDLPRCPRHKKDKDGNSRKAKFDTVFHSLMRDSVCYSFGSLWNRSKEESKAQILTNNFELRDFLFYMLMHFISVMLSIFVVGYATYSSKLMHQIFLSLAMLSATYRGAKRYTLCHSNVCCSHKETII